MNLMPLLSFAAALLIVVVGLNIWHRQVRSSMTPEETDQERRDMSVW